MLSTASPLSHVPERKPFEPHLHASYAINTATKLTTGQIASIRCAKYKAFGSSSGVFEGKPQVKARTCFSAINGYTTAMQLHNRTNNGQSQPPRVVGLIT